ncbi:uncharacterized protein [Physcomitrium patens]|uniref:Uncharacterized protein n=1 Tax=Physcomitrium patens TaxID=3218 RepID=A0A2K1KK83_PHYPA|nr:hypothetical protein PHYPA_007867 [Physcomitrium patens]
MGPEDPCAASPRTVFSEGLEWIVKCGNGRPAESNGIRKTMRGLRIIGGHTATVNNRLVNRPKSAGSRVRARPGKEKQKRNFGISGITLCDSSLTLNLVPHIGTKRK